MSADLDDDLALAFRLADEADALSLARFRALDLVVETKPDLTPVSDADRAVEEALRTRLTTERPSDAVLGEEFGLSGTTAHRRWIIDPIDGTKNYVRGVPVWATLLALAIDEPRGQSTQSPVDSVGDVALGLVSAPALGMRWWAARGCGAWSGTNLADARRMQVSRVAEVANSSLSFSEWNDPAWDSTRTRHGFTSLLAQVWRSRAYGDFWSHVMVAEGALDIALEPQLSLWDMAALIPIVNEAGGKVTAFDGSSALSGGNALTTNGRLHDQVLALLAPSDG